MVRALRETPLHLVLNMDETSWKLIAHQFLTVAQKGAEGISCLFDGDPKACITAIACIDAAGGRLPLWVVAKGKTSRSETKIRTRCHKDIEAGRLFLTHQQSGWTSREIAAQYLEWLADRYRRPIILVWDLYAAHRDATIQAIAARIGIRLEFVPAGQTDELQLLDRRVFGNLKQRARRRFDNEIMQGRENNLNMAWAIQVLVKVWYAMAQDEILSAWEHFYARDRE
jgi:hypothetical protein